MKTVNFNYTTYSLITHILQENYYSYNLVNGGLG